MTEREGLFLYPEIFFPFPGGKVRAFFTGKIPGVDREAVCRELEASPCKLFMPVQKHTSDVIVYEDCTDDEAATPPLRRPMRSSRPKPAWRWASWWQTASRHFFTMKKQA